MSMINDMPKLGQFSMEDIRVSIKANENENQL